MATPIQKYRSLDTSRGQRYVAANRGREVQYDYFPASGKRQTDRLVVISPGWLGTLTLNGVAQAVSEQGHDVALVHHNDSSWHDVLQPNKVRSLRVHAVTKSAVERSGKSSVHFIHHSNGNRDVTTALTYQMAKPKDELLYKIEEVTSVAGVGTNGKRIDPRLFYKELGNVGAYTGENLPQAMKTVGYSALNFVTRPLISAVEGIGTLNYDARPSMELFEKAGVAVNRVFHDQDWIVRPPDDTSGVLILPGGHLTAAIDPEAFIHLAAA